MKMYENISIKETIKQNWDERSSTFDLSPGHVIGSKEEKEAWISLFQDKFGKGIQKILDIGAGTGFLSLILTEMGYDVVGVDFSEEMLERAKKKAADQGLKLKVEFKLDDAEALSFKSESFDAVVNRAVLWTLPNPKGALSEWKRVLKPGGKLCFFLHEPHHNGLTQRFRRQLGNILILFIERRDPWHSLDNKKLGVELPFRGGVEPSVITELLEDAGFEQISAEPMHEISRLKAENMSLCYRVAHDHNHIQYCYTAVKPKIIGEE
jgi:ubiquinone/menaquinone biosynthesis C-methylase UbiE